MFSYKTIQIYGIKHIPVNNTNLLSKATKKSIGKEHKRWYKVLIMGKSTYKTNTLKRKKKHWK